MPLLSRKHSRAGIRTICRNAGAALRTFVIIAVVALLCRTIILHSKPQHAPKWLTGVARVRPEAGTDGPACVSWRQTDHCTPSGIRRLEGDKHCSDWIDKGPGYCECTASRIVQRAKCGKRPPFRCQDACRLLADEPFHMQRMPTNVTCPAGSNVKASQVHLGLSSHDEASEIATKIWSDIQTALDDVGTLDVMTESRTELQDWVREGLHPPRHHIETAKAQWRRFLLAAPEYPAEYFEGRGVVILAGSLQYMVSAWVNIVSLCRAGCKLDIQVMFPAHELPSNELVRTLKHLGATSVSLPRSLEACIARAAGSDASMAGFMLKIAAIILSTFQEIVFLDSDNVALADVGQLFSTPQYARYGALLWPDYWESSAAPDLLRILGLKDAPLGTTESGQMVFDKARVWDALMLSAYFNMQSGFYYEIFSNVMGKGDKESFPFAFAATNMPYYKIPYPVGSVGQLRSYCSPDQRFCWNEFTGNTIVQHDLSGNMLFLHANLSPKWNLHIPGDFKEYTRRWQVLVPHQIRVDNVVVFLGHDVEFEIWQSLIDLRCSAGFAQYAEGPMLAILRQQMRHMDGQPFEQQVGLSTFHPQNEVFTDVMPILRDHAKEPLATSMLKMQQLMQLLPGALSGAKAASTMKRYTPAWGYFKKSCARHDLPFLPAAPLTVALYLLSLTQTAKSFATVKLASAAIAAFHSFASQPEVTRASNVVAIREHAKRNLRAGDNRKDPIPWEKVEEVCMVLAKRPISCGFMRNVSLAAAISLAFCGFLRYDDMSCIKVGGITISSDKASMEIKLESRKNDQYRAGSDITVTAVHGYADPVRLVITLIQRAGLFDGDRPLISAVTRHEGQDVYGTTPSPTSL